MDAIFAIDVNVPLKFVPRTTAPIYFVGSFAAIPKTELLYIPFAIFNNTILPRVDQKNIDGIFLVLIITKATVKIKQTTSVRIDHTIRVVNLPLKINLKK